MRTIKFRAWDKERGKMITPEELLSGDGLYLIVAEKFKDSYVPMQFTGLPDKNSKEIYEGDVVRNERGELGEIAFENGGFFARYLPPYDWDPMEHGDGLLDRSEVIGNVYESPELLSDRAERGDSKEEPNAPMK